MVLILFFDPEKNMASEQTGKKDFSLINGIVSRNKQFVFFMQN